MTDFYRFPAMAKLGEFTEEEQLKHMQSEATEAVMQYARWYLTTTIKVDRDLVRIERNKFGMELMDYIHSGETALRMLFTDEEVEELRNAVIEKNRARGYYDA